MTDPLYELVQLKNGTWSVRSRVLGETFHPVIGPVAEAEALYVRQLQLPQRMARHSGEFVIWDIGLGAAANICTVLQASATGTNPVRIVSFDCTSAPLRFALEHPRLLEFIAPYQQAAQTLLDQGQVEFTNGNHLVSWNYFEADFPSLVRLPTAQTWPKPHAILFDAFSPARNPEMWTLPLFERLHGLLDPSRDCLMATYSRSTLLRVTLLLAGFFVGTGHATGDKDETTIAANSLRLISEPLDPKWLSKVRRSSSAEPMIQPLYRQQPLSSDNWERLERHAQFRGSHGITR